MIKSGAIKPVFLLALIGIVLIALVEPISANGQTDTVNSGADSQTPRMHCMTGEHSANKTMMSGMMGEHSAKKTMMPSMMGENSDNQSMMQHMMQQCMMHHRMMGNHSDNEIMMHCMMGDTRPMRPYRENIQLRKP
jgi:hypothetical protein